MMTMIAWLRTRWPVWDLLLGVDSNKSCIQYEAAGGA